MTLNEKLKQRRLELGLTLEQVGDYVGVGKSTVRKWETGLIKDMKRSQIAKYAEILKISPAVILGISDDIEPVPSPRSIVIPLYTLICCGNGGFVDDNIIDYITLPSDLLVPGKDYFAQRASGDSMINADIHDGDILVFEKTGHIENGQIGCFCIDDNEAMCKRYRVKTDEHGHVTEIVLIPANDDIVKYPPIVIDAQMERFRCIGRLVLDISNMEKR